MASSIYFPADGEPDGKRKVLRLRLDAETPDLAEFLHRRSSSELKAALGTSYSELAEVAHSSRRSINSQAIAILSASLSDTPNQNPLLSELSGTYRGGAGDFFHSLFPYLEAFSPDFVRQLTAKYAPDARFLLDPFGGCGTAPLTFAYDDDADRVAYYCEINPLMQRIVALKEWLRSLSESTRRRLAERCDFLGDRIDTYVDDAIADDLIAETYLRVFRQGPVFPNDTYEQVLKARSMLLHLQTDEPSLANVLELALLASLVPASDMQRAGDLRRKRPDERAKISSDLVEHVRPALERIRLGLTSFESSHLRTLLLAADAKKLGEIPSVGADMLLTSPPYLNGTNYFRNTRLELWFLGVLRAGSDLATLRDSAITAGINDVRGKRGRNIPPHDQPSCLRDCLEDLDESAYDRRIPQMVRWYAYDLECALAASLGHLKNGAPIIVDIGDSIYSGVKVPTDALVSELLERNGCVVSEVIPIRQRMARKGQKVHQVCIVGRKGSARAKRQMVGLARKVSLSRWRRFERELPHRSEPYSKRNWGHAWHSLCSFQGKLKPAIARFLVDAVVPEGGSVLDPFVGVGTIPFEAALSGRTTYGFDLSPAAIAIATAKLSKPDHKLLDAGLDDLNEYLKAYSRRKPRPEWLPGFNRPLAEYYHQRTLQEIRLARQWFAERHPWSPSDSLLLSCAMHVLHGNRPYALSRRSHPVTPYAPTGPVEYKSIVQKIREKLNRTLVQGLPDDFCEGHIYEADATGWWPLEIQDLDAVVTSPPFFDSTRFFMANWIRLWFAGWTEYDFKSGQRRFLEEQQKVSLDCYNPVFQQSRERLQSCGVLLMHLGKSRKCDMGEELRKRGLKWFRKAELFDESVVNCESHGIRDKGTVTSHQYLLLH